MEPSFLFKTLVLAFASRRLKQNFLPLRPNLFRPEKLERFVTNLREAKARTKVLNKNDGFRNPREEIQKSSRGNRGSKSTLLGIGFWKGSPERCVKLIAHQPFSYRAISRGRWDLFLTIWLNFGPVVLLVGKHNWYFGHFFSPPVRPSFRFPDFPTLANLTQGDLDKLKASPECFHSAKRDCE